jgi:hypothetical protein
MNEDKIFDIEFDCEGKHYTGWVNPSEELHKDGLPASFHVVLNNVSFGYVSFANGKWRSDDQRPAELVEATGNQIMQRYNRSKNKINA